MAAGAGRNPCCPSPCCPLCPTETPAAAAAVWETLRCPRPWRRSSPGAAEPGARLHCLQAPCAGATWTAAHGAAVAGLAHPTKRSRLPVACLLL
jgi:hypothetical protein